MALAVRPSGGPRTAAGKLDEFDKDTSLKVMDLSGLTVGEKDMKRLADLIVQGACTAVLLSGCDLSPKLTVQLAEALASPKAATVKTLNLSQNAIGSKVKAAADNKTVVEKDANDKGTVALAATLLSDACGLVEVDVSDNQIGLPGAQKLARALEKNKKLLTLNISNNPIGEQGCARIAMALKTKNRTLKTLNIESCMAGRFGGDAYASALLANDSLSTLNLTSNGLEDHGAVALGKALEKNSGLADLSLESNQISPWGAKIFAESLKRNKGLKYLNIQLNSIGTEACSMFFDALEENTSLKGILRDEV